MGGKYSDSIGFVHGSYFLETSYDRSKVAFIGDPESSAYVKKRFRRDHISNFLKPFASPAPRYVWGCESPIELFLAQALAQKGMFPWFQCIVFEDGSISPSYWDSYIEGKINKRNGVVTVFDMYFPEQRKGVFCDSFEFHGTPEAVAKDRRISEKLAEVGLVHIRVSGAEIVNDLPGAVSRVAEFLA